MPLRVPSTSEVANPFFFYSPCTTPFFVILCLPRHFIISCYCHLASVFITQIWLSADICWLNCRNGTTVRHNTPLSCRGVSVKKKPEGRRLQKRDVTTRLEVATPFASNFIATHAPVSDSCLDCVRVHGVRDCIQMHLCPSRTCFSTERGKHVRHACRTTCRVPWPR